MSTEKRCSPDKLLQPEDGALDAGLRMSVVVLDAVQQLAEAPVGVGLCPSHGLFRQLSRAVLAPALHGAIKVRRQKHRQKRRHQVVDALHVAASRVPACAQELTDSAQEITLMCMHAQV